MGEDVTISYRGARYEIGRGPGFYGIWVTGASRSQPFAWWPQTPEGWRDAWSRFTGIEAPGTVVPAGEVTAVPAGYPVPAGQPTTPAAEYPGPAAQPAARARRPGAAALVAASLLGVGVLLGIAGLFPDYFGGTSLAGEPVELVPHAIYLAAWSASAVLILLGGARLRAGALAGLAMSIVTFGLFLADLGQAVTGGATVGAGLALGLAGWLACTAGSAMAAFSLRPAGAGRPARPRAHEQGLVVALALAAIGTAIAFAPSWDSYTVRTSSGAVQSLTLGNAFANPAVVIAGNVIVMVALVAVVVVAALWRPVGAGAALLAGAIIPMAAQAISALVQLGEAASPSVLGISPAQAAQAGLTISSGATPEFWIYCAFVAALVLLAGARLLSRPPSAALDRGRPIPSTVS